MEVYISGSFQQNRRQAFFEWCLWRQLLMRIRLPIPIQIHDFGKQSMVECTFRGVQSCLCESSIGSFGSGNCQATSLSRKRRAIRELNYDSSVKIFFKFRFWKKPNTNIIGVAHPTDLTAPSVSHARYAKEENVINRTNSAVSFEGMLIAELLEDKWKYEINT
ncbi:13560_t:CDS:2 [Gigaspora margarita]|uniref:13560_t:CDS:1 n=1 Tax=Gigaspora margarita TaxID=4874 RepID=A0ABN7V697_GIGMA|nr:13560_t:CDS:2 [Gigaspora margarita]